MVELKEYYTTKEEVIAALAEYNEGRPEAEQKCYIYQYNDYTQQKMYIVCDREFFYFYRNLERNERRERDIESRCVIPSKKYGLKKCMADCDNCPYGKYKRDGSPLSLDFIYKDEEGQDFCIEIEDDSPSVVEEMIEEEKQQLVKQLLDELDETDKFIIESYYKWEKSDREIAEHLHSNLKNVNRRRLKLMNILQEKIKKFEF